MDKKSIALLLYGDENSTRDVFTEEKYKGLAEALVDEGFIVKTVLYNDSIANYLENELIQFSAVLVWVNPIEQGGSRYLLDELLLRIANKGVYVSTHPEIILKIGTKKVLYSTKNMDWGVDTEIYSEYKGFENRFLSSMKNSDIRVLKQYRGNGGNGVFKVCFADENCKNIKVIHAPTANEVQILTVDEFHKKFSKYFEDGGLLIDQEWIKNITNGMVRCYLTGDKVSGFGYQESNALCPLSDDPESRVRPTSGRFYFSENCGLFQDLRKIMESKWIPQLLESHSVSADLTPLIWDIDLFINDVNTHFTEKKYSLCEINVSCVSPFPSSCIKFITNELITKIFH